MKRIPLLTAATAVFLCLLSPAVVSAQYVSIQDMGTHFRVSIDYTTATPAQVGAELGTEIAAAVPTIQSLLDSYLDEAFSSNAALYAEMLARAAEVKNQVPAGYVAEVDALAVGMGLGTVNTLGDGLFSRDELWIMNLTPEVARGAQCSALAAWGPRSATGLTSLMRLLDWGVGSSYQLAKLQAVETAVLSGGRSVTNIGFLGYRAMLTGYNRHGVFAAVLDSATGVEPYTATNKYSYAFDLRRAVEEQSGLDGVAAHMSDPFRDYPFNHLVFLADRSGAAVLENNFSGSGSNMRRALRYDDSTLNPGVTWGYSNAVAAVNAFMLEGNTDNYTGGTYNTARWGSILGEMSSAGDTLDWDELKAIASFDNGDGPGSMSTGDLYSSVNVMIVLFQPVSGRLEIAFHPRDAALPADPVFTTVFAGATPTAGGACLGLILE